jgi:hypothetical protein
MTVENTTPNRGYQLPDATNDLADDVLRLIAALSAIDVDVANQIVAIAGKAALVHGHVIEDVTGLASALAAKLDADQRGVANGVASLGGDGKVPAAQLPAALFGAMAYQGTWNANTNTPTIPAATSANKGWYYKVATAGSTTVDGENDWKIGDWIVSSGTGWDKIDNTDQVSSVAGLVGVITAAALRTALSLGGAALLNVGTGAGTVAAGNDSRISGALPKAGGTMTGALTLAGAPAADLQAASKKYVDDLVGTQAAETLSASGTWTKPAGLSADRLVLIRGWGGGGGGSSQLYRGGAGGGGCAEIIVRAGDLAASIAYTIGSGGAGGTNTGGTGGNTTFGTLLTAYGGTGGGTDLGGNGGNGSGPGGGTATGGAGGTAAGGGASYWGGGGGSDDGTGGSSVYGGGGGGSQGGAGGASTFGGAGGGPGVAGSVPGGGGGSLANGAAGQIKIFYL